MILILDLEMIDIKTKKITEEFVKMFISLLSVRNVSATIQIFIKLAKTGSTFHFNTMHVYGNQPLSLLLIHNNFTIENLSAYYLYYSCITPPTTEGRIRYFRLK